MSLKILRLNKSKEMLEKELGGVEEKRSTLLSEAEKVKTAIGEAETPDDLELIDKRSSEIEDELEVLDNRQSEIDVEIEKIDSEIAEIDNKKDEVEEKANEPKEERNMQTRGLGLKVNKYETRSEMLERLEIPEVREFYGIIAKAFEEKRDITNVNVTIPEIIINMIQMRLGDYSKLYSEVNVVPLTGTGRVILDGAIPEAVWLECCGELTELDLSFSDTEIDCYMVGGYMSVCRANIEDSFINLANYVEAGLTRAVAKAVDKAIMTGLEADKMPTGVIPMIPAANKVTIPVDLGQIVKQQGLIDDGEDGAEIGEVIAVMRRSTYYNRLSEKTLLPTDDGRYVVSTGKNPYLPDGTRIVYSQYVAADKIILGDFKKYLLGERAGMRLEQSDHIGFLNDRRYFKILARYDGKPVFPEMFVEITLDDSVNP